VFCVVAMYLAPLKNIVATARLWDYMVSSLCISTTKSRLSKQMAISIGWAGNWLVYVLLAGGIVWQTGKHSLLIISSAVLGTLVAHSIYPFIKRKVARLRPFEKHQEFIPLLRPLDKYSFPSGHVMTLTTVLLPIVMVFPTTSLGFSLLWLAMVWARLASAHHFLSDIVGGAILGVAISYPVSSFILLTQN